MHSRPSVKHVLEVLEWFYKLTEKILFQKRGLVFYYPRWPPPRFGKRPYFSRIFFCTLPLLLYSGELRICAMTCVWSWEMNQLDSYVVEKYQLRFALGQATRNETSGAPSCCRNCSLSAWRCTMRQTRRRKTGPLWNPSLSTKGRHQNEKHTSIRALPECGGRGFTLARIFLTLFWPINSP